MTVRRVLELLQSNGPSTRAELTRLSGISAPTVSKAIAALLEAGLVEEAAQQSSSLSSLGRPGTVLRPARDTAQVIGVVVDARQCRISASGLDGVIREDLVQTCPTPPTYQALIDQIAAAAELLMQRPGVRTLSLGMSIPGLINRREARAVFSPNLHLTDGQSPAADLSQRLGIECVMYQESQALCLGERMFSRPELLDDFAVLEISTGLGLGVINEGRLMEGRSGLAGELGHVTVAPEGRLCGCGNRGCLETVATDSAFALALSERIGRSLDIDEALRLVRDNEVHAEQELRSVCEYLAIAMAAAINIFNPAMLFVHGRLFDAQDGLFEMTCELTRRRTLAPSFADCRILRARYNKSQGAIAAAMQSLFDSLGPLVGE